MVQDDDNYLYFPEGNTIWRQDNANNFPYNNSHNRIMDGWTELKPLFSGTDTLQEITAIAATPIAHNKVYYGTNEGKLYKINKLVLFAIHFPFPSLLLLLFFVVGG